MVLTLQVALHRLSAPFREFFLYLRGRLAQLARALAWHARGHRFKSCIAHHLSLIITTTYVSSHDADFGPKILGGTFPVHLCPNFALGMKFRFRNARIFNEEFRREFGHFCGWQEVTIRNWIRGLPTRSLCLHWGNKHVVGFSDLAHSLLLHMQRPPVSFLLASQGCIAFINYQEYYATNNPYFYRNFQNMLSFFTNESSSARQTAVV